MYAISPSGSDLYVGGQFTQTGDGAVTNLNYISKLAILACTAAATACTALLRLQPVRWLAGAAVLAGLVIVLWVGLDLRTAGMRSTADALVYLDDYDEGVNVSAAQLLLAGATPYRDYFFAHPPLGILVLASVLRFHFVPWGDALTFVLARYASIAFGMATIVVVFAVASRLGGWLSGLLAAGTLAVDILVIAVDRRAMFEPLMNLASILAILTFLLALEQDRSRRWWLAGAGALGACAALVKTTGVVSLGAMLVYCLVRLLNRPTCQRRGEYKSPQVDSFQVRARDLLCLLSGAIAATLMITGWFLFQSSTDFLREVYLFQIFRPPDGMQDAGTRLSTILADDDAHLTIYLGLGGGALVLLRGLGSGRWGQWGLILLWTALTVILLGTARTFFFHYYSQLAVPLCILAGALVSKKPTRLTFEKGNKPAHWRTRLVLAAQAVLLLYMLGTNLQPAQFQYNQARAIAQDQSSILLNTSRFLASKTPPSARVLTFLPALTIVGSRPPIKSAGRYLIDSYGYMQYLNMGMEQAWLPRATYGSVLDAVRGDEAQKWIEQVAAQADYVVMDDRGRTQLRQETIFAVRGGREPVYRADNVTIWARQ